MVKSLAAFNTDVTKESLVWRCFRMSRGIQDEERARGKCFVRFGYSLSNKNVLKSEIIKPLHTILTLFTVIVLNQISMSELQIQRARSAD